MTYRGVNADSYDTDTYRCVEPATDVQVTAPMQTRWRTASEHLDVVAPVDGGKYTVAADGTPAALPGNATDTRAAWVPRGCTGYVAVEVATPDAGTPEDTNDDVSRWRVQAIPLKAAAAS